MTEKDAREGYVVVERADGSLAEGCWYDGVVHDAPRKPSQSAYTLDAVFGGRNPLALKLDTPFWPSRPAAPWRIHKLDGVWLIEKRQTAGWETHRYCATGADAFATFAASGAR
ncbi:hypothetical protein [Mycobacteroides chelonae]|uniref:hypothetical protein n=1 Tax=Mycobacteroides chelonae TaxID=1774 RepID=UPI00099342D1|nr:hypothetical protein [Mycobacteroides chelonae]